MKCVIRGEHFKKLITKGGKIAEHRAQNPIQESVLVRVNKEQKSIYIEAATFDVWTEYRGHAAVEHEGTVVIPARPLTALAAHIQTNDDVFLEQEGNILKITTKTGKTAIHGYNAKEFHSFSFPQKEAFMMVKSSVLFPFLKRALVSVARSSLKPELASVLLRVTPRECVIASTDGFRLTEDRLAPAAFIRYPTLTIDILIPYRSLEELIRMFEEDEDDIHLLYHEGIVSVSSSSARMTLRATEGAFPPYEQIIPSRFAVSLTVPRIPLIDMLRHASIFSGKLYALSFSFASKNSELLFHTFNQDIGEFSSRLAVEGIGEDKEVVCNWRYFLDGAQGFSGNAITLSFQNESTPILMRDADKPSQLYLLMPMRGM